MSYPGFSVSGVEEALAGLERAVAGCRPVRAWAMSDSALVSCLDRLQALAQQLAAVQLGLLREIDGRGVAAGQGATGTVAWLRERHRISAGAATRQVRLAAALDGDLPAAAEAL